VTALAPGAHRRPQTVPRPPIEAGIDGRLLPKTVAPVVDLRRRGARPGLEERRVIEGGVDRAEA
jgi:hypothetical protein